MITDKSDRGRRKYISEQCAWAVLWIALAVWLVWVHFIYTPTPLDCPEGEREVRAYTLLDLFVPPLQRSCTENGINPYGGQL